MASVAINLSGADADGTVTHFKVTALPTLGALYTDAGLLTALVINTDYAATAEALTVYYDAASVTGADSFTYMAKDDAGAYSLDATVSVDVTAIINGYRYFRLDITVTAGVGGLSLDDMRLVADGIDYPSVNMTGLSSPSPLVASASEESHASYGAYLAFDAGLGSSATRWYTSATVATVGWLQIDLGVGNEITPTQLKLKAPDGASARGLVDFRLLASNSGSFSGEEAVLLNVSGEGAWADYQVKTFALS